MKYYKYVVGAALLLSFAGCGEPYGPGPDRDELVANMNSYYISSDVSGLRSDKVISVAWIENIDSNGTINQVSISDGSVLASYNPVTNSIGGHSLDELELTGISDGEINAYRRDYIWAEYVDEANGEVIKYIAERDVGLVEIRHTKIGVDDPYRDYYKSYTFTY